MLEEIYTEGVAGVTVNGETVPYGTYVAWLNYLFDEDFRVKNYDSWKLFEALHEEKYFRDDLINWRDCGPYGYAFVAGCEMCAVKYGTAEVFKRMHVEDNDGNIIFIRAMKMMLECLEKYQKSSLLTKEEQLEELMGYICKHYEGKQEEFEDDTIIDLSISLFLSSASAFLVKAIAENYEKDFWELWEKVKHVVKREMEEYYGKNAVSYSSLTTAELFRQSEDDLIPWWEKEGEIVFSQELENWFVWLKERYEEILAKGEKMEHPLKKVAELMEYAFMQYYNIFTFEEFWEETTEHLSDERYQALWLLYEELLMDEQLQKEGEIIIDPDAPVRQLKRHWDFMSQEEKNNRARVTYRRYMALVANKELRQKVFGF